MDILYSLRLALEEKGCEELPKSSKLDFSEKISANNFALLNIEDKNSPDKGGMDLPMLRALFAIRQNSGEPSVWEIREALSLFIFWV